MYQTINISCIDQHINRFLWRNFDVNRKPDIREMNVVSFGDKPAGSITMAALAKLQSTCDDMLDSVNDIKTAEKLTHEIEYVLSKG